MNLGRAQKIRYNLRYLEGLIARETHEYIWKVLIVPADKEELRHFAGSIDPTKPFLPNELLQAYSNDFAVYFFLKKNGQIIYKEYEEFLYLNNIRLKTEGQRLVLEMTNP